jgi:hypothetical protein
VKALDNGWVFSEKRLHSLQKTEEMGFELEGFRGRLRLEGQKIFDL